MKKLRPYQQEAVNKAIELLCKEDSPLLVNASVGAGKSLIIAEIINIFEKQGRRVLCLTNNAELVRNNSATFKEQGGSPSIYCAALHEKDISNPIVFGSPITILNAIKKEEPISKMPFNLIVIDEAHGINYNNKASSYMRLLSHYKLLYPSMRVIGLTGTPFRGKGIGIVGEQQFFKNQACDISTSWLIEQGYLAKPLFGAPAVKSLDFKDVEINALGQFNNKQLQDVVTSSGRLTAEIMSEVLRLVDNKRNGAFIFASTKAHCLECYEALPKDTSAIITGDTPQDERIKILDAARNGFIKYLININVLTVGIDVPNFDTVVFVRPTESLVLYTQAIGRGLRLYPCKENCLILDYAGNLERHGDIDNAIINEALQPKEGQEEDYIIPCYTCGALNKVLSRRCVGSVNGQRCSYYFDFKSCPHCGVENDITARACRECYREIIDPNKKLHRNATKAELFEFEVLEAKYTINTNSYDKVIFNVNYKVSPEGNITERYFLTSDMSKRIFYHQFVKKHFKEPSKVHRCMDSARGMHFAINKLGIKTPDKLICYKKDNAIAIKKKVFLDEGSYYDGL